MGTYHYEAVDQAGRSERGVLEAESERLARQQLLSRGLLTVSLKAGRSRAAARARSAGLRRTELSWLTRQLASLVAAGLSLIFGVTRIVNFAHGSFYMIGAYLAFWLTTRTGSLWLAILLFALTVASTFGVGSQDLVDGQPVWQPA